VGLRGVAWGGGGTSSRGRMNMQSGMFWPARARLSEPLCAWRDPGLVSGAWVENANLLWEGGSENSKRIVLRRLGRAGGVHLIVVQVLEVDSLLHRLPP
jgi:hypothetical protein